MFYGFILAGALWVFYGLTLGMKFGAWGYFAPVISKEVGLTNTEIGFVASVVLAGTAVFTAMAGPFIARYGTRKSMFLGQALGAVGIAITAFATPFWEFIVGAIFLAASTSFGGVIPIQTLVTHWFQRYRSTVMAAVFTATPIWGAASYPFYKALMDVMEWRWAMFCLIAIFPLGALIIHIFIRNKPADMGLSIDGIAEPLQAATAAANEGSQWTSRSALLSLPFAAITGGVIVCTMPYLYFVTFGRFVIESLGVSGEVAVAALAGLSFATLFGRLCVAAADLIPERYMMMAALLANPLGLALLAFIKTPAMIYAGVFLMGWSFGLSFLLAPILLARAFGRKVFAIVEATRMALVTGVNAALTSVYGLMIDQTGSYMLPVQLLVALNAAAIIGYAFYLKRDRVKPVRASS